jgi:hypothetical protein
MHQHDAKSNRATPGDHDSTSTSLPSLHTARQLQPRHVTMQMHAQEASVDGKNTTPDEELSAHSHSRQGPTMHLQLPWQVAQHLLLVCELPHNTHKRWPA